MRGAPSLCAHAAIALGAGIVELIAPAIHPLTPREIISHQIASHRDGTISTSEKDRIDNILSRASVVAIGPGLGGNVDTIGMLADCLSRMDSTVQVIIDADGLRMAPPDLTRTGMVLTPHMGEFARLLGKDRMSVTNNYIELAQQWAKQYQCVLHLKHVPSVTTDGMTTSYLHSGTPAMATAGAGDVLTGIIAALCAQGVQTYEATRLGALIHARAGEHIVQSTYKRSIMAHELIDASICVASTLTQ